MSHELYVMASQQQQQQQQQPFYGPLIQDNPGELVSETIGHFNPHYPPRYR